MYHNDMAIPYRSAYTKSTVKRAPFRVLASADAAGEAMCADFVRIARDEINKKGAFYVAVPGRIKSLNIVHLMLHSLFSPIVHRWLCGKAVKASQTF